MFVGRYKLPARSGNLPESRPPQFSESAARPIQESCKRRVRAAYGAARNMPMTSALALQNQNSAVDASLSRAEVLDRYRGLREISRQLNAEIMDCISHDALLREARKLALARGKTLILEDLEEMNYVFDLAIHTAAAGRSRAIDRYARSARFAAESEQARMLEAMRNSRFSLLLIDGRHQAAGLIARDLLRRGEAVWLVDIGLESSLDEGDVLATRLFNVGPFSITAGANVPCDLGILEDVMNEIPARLCERPLEVLAEDRRFAEGIFRIALASGISGTMLYRDVPDEA
jgi:hypothetical protein